jgi:hypothetical protein
MKLNKGRGKNLEVTLRIESVGLASISWLSFFIVLENFD